MSHIYCNPTTYVFKSWDKNLVAVNGNAEYIAQFDSVHIEYTIIFKNYDGTVLSSKTYHYGDAVEEPKSPVKPADNTYTYTFKAWDKEVASVSGNDTYTATYEATYIEYAVVFKNYDGTVLNSKTYHYGDTVEEPSIPKKAADNTYTYVFKSWDKNVVAVNGNTEYIAQFDSVFIEYTVIFQNYDGTVLSSKKYHYGDKVIVPSIPVKETDNQYTYTFAGWDKETSNCVGNETYTATYSFAEVKDSRNESLSGGVIAGIATGSAAAVGLGGFSLFWFVIKKKRFSDLFKGFKKK